MIGSNVSMVAKMTRWVAGT